MSTRRIVVVGAGGSGIPLAARLAQRGHDVVLLESGAAFAAEPAWTVRAGLPDAPSAFTYAAELTPGRAWRIARGRALGGSTAVNGAYFQRPDPADFAAWARQAGPEWTYSACLPALRRLESDRDYPAAPGHGDSGPVPVQRPDPSAPISGAFLAAAAAAGAASQPDTNDGGPSGAGPLPRNALGAQRFAVDTAYRELLGGVDVRTGVDVHAVLFRGRTAVGVAATCDGADRMIEADEVVLAAGAIETPRLLLRSGIGDAASIDGSAPAVAARRGVGRNLSDHAAVDIAWRARPGVADPDGGAAWTAVWNAPAGALAAHPVEILLAVVPTAAIVTGDAAARGPLDLRVTLARPDSRGAVGLDPQCPIRYRHLSQPAEQESLDAAVRAARGILTSGEMAEVVGAVGEPAGGDIRDSIGTALHSCGTARMGPQADPDAVTDAHGRVHDVDRLRVADASILPRVPARGTALAAVLIGERIAELMATE